MDLLDIVVLGDPIPKGRARSGRGNHYTPARTVAAENVIRGVMNRDLRGRRPYDGAVGIDVVFYCATRRPCDGDNLLKLVTDSLQRGAELVGGVILNDAQIEDWHCRLYRRAPDQLPRTEIRVFTL